METVVQLFGIEHHITSEEYVWNVADTRDVLVSDWLDCVNPAFGKRNHQKLCAELLSILSYLSVWKHIKKKLLQGSSGYTAKRQ